MIHSTGKMLNRINTAASVQRSIKPTRLLCEIDCCFLDIFSYLLPHVRELELCQGHHGDQHEQHQ